MSNVTIPTVPVNSTVYETLGNFSGGVEWFDQTNGYYYEAFGLGTGQPVNISLTSNNFDTWLGILNLDTGTLVQIDDNGGGGTNSALSFVPKFGDNYAVVVSSADGSHNATGAYQLSVTYA